MSGVPDGYDLDLRRATVLGTTVEDFTEHLCDPETESAGHVVAIAWVLDPATRRVLLVRHRQLGWSCPGGHLEPDELPRDAAIREVREETGLALTPVIDAAVTLTRTADCPRTATFGDVHWTLGYRFHSTADPTAAEDDQPVRWFPLDRLPHPHAADLDVILTALV